MVGNLTILQSWLIGCLFCQSAPDPPVAHPATTELAAYDLAASELHTSAEAARPFDEACPRLSEACICEDRNHAWSDLLKNHSFGCWTLDVGGSLRHRFEHQDNFQVRRYGDPNASSDTFVLQRFRLDLDLKHQENWRTFVQFQDARPFGTIFSMDDFAVGSPYWNYFDLRQAYLERKPDDDRPLGFRIGRQIITYRDTRVWGPGEWGNVGRYSWDVAKLTVDVPLAEVDSTSTITRFTPTGRTRC
jgi:hypothetical protein